MLPAIRLLLVIRMLNKFVTIAALLLLLMSVVILSASLTASAVSIDSTSVVQNGGYIVKPAKPGGGSITPLTVYATISQGQTNCHTKVVSDSITVLNVDLNWGNPANSLQLTIYSPDGYTFGPYYDADDGVIDGRINLGIYNPNGIAKGTWYYNVYGYRVTGQQSYYI